MTRRVAVLRPEPGNAQSVARLHAMGLTPVALPIFTILPLDWEAPVASDYDGLLFTSANSLRFGGAGLMALRSLPVLAVGAATARASKAAGFDVIHTGTKDAAQLLAQAQATGKTRLLHIGGEDKTISAGGMIADSIAVYASRPSQIDRALLSDLAGCVVLLHSPRAAAHFAGLVDESAEKRSNFRIATISAAVAAAAGEGWAGVTIADAPDETALLNLAARLAD